MIKPDKARADLFLTHVVTFMSMPKCNQKIRNIWLNYWGKVDKELGEIIATRLKEATSQQKEE